MLCHLKCWQLNQMLCVLYLMIGPSCLCNSVTVGVRSVEACCIASSWPIYGSTELLLCHTSQHFIKQFHSLITSTTKQAFYQQVLKLLAFLLSQIVKDTQWAFLCPNKDMYLLRRQLLIITLTNKCPHRFKSSIFQLMLNITIFSWLYF